MKKSITLQEAITRDIGEIGTPERDKFEKELTEWASSPENINETVTDFVKNYMSLENENTN